MVDKLILSDKMRHFICSIFIVFLISIPSSATSSAGLCLFTADYDSDTWEVKRIAYELVDNIPEGWYPLKAVSEYLPIDVSWDEDERDVVVSSHNLPYNKALCTFRYNVDKLPAEVKIKDGVAYCSPRLLAYFLWNRGFLFNGEVYYYAGESRKSQLIQSGDSELFTGNVITAMYEIKLKMSEEYAFIRKHLTGGIAYATADEVPAHIAGASAYILPSIEKPICYIVGDRKSNEIFARSIAHEAFHVWQCHNGGVNEESAHTYGKKVQNGLEEIQ